MPIACVEVDLGDSKTPTFAISTVPFLYRDGELAKPAQVKNILCRFLPSDLQPCPAGLSDLLGGEETRRACAGKDRGN